MLQRGWLKHSELLIAYKHSRHRVLRLGRDAIAVLKQSKGVKAHLPILCIHVVIVIIIIIIILIIIIIIIIIIIMEG